MSGKTKSPGTAPHGRCERLLLGLLTIPILTAYAIMARFSLNVALIDDYPTLMHFAVQYQATPTFAARLHYIFADQYTEYKLSFIHVFTAVQLALVHQVNFAFTFWVGQAALLGLLALFWKTWFTQENGLRRLLLFTPIVLLLFSLNYAEALDWVACCIGYLLTILLALVSLHLLAARRSSWAFACAWVFALMACSIAANAFLLGPLGLLVLVPRRAWLRTGLWCGCFVVALVPYFIHYVPEMHSGTGPRTLIPLFFIAFLGSASPLGKAVIPLGCVVLTVYLAALRSRFYRTHSSAMLGTTWLLMSAALAAIGRGRTGLAFATVSRYQVYSNLFLVFCYGYLATRIANTSFSAPAKRRILGATIVISILFCVRADVVGYRILRTRYQMVLFAFQRYGRDPGQNSPMFFNQPIADNFFGEFEVRARQDTNAAIAAGLYHPPR